MADPPCMPGVEVDADTAERDELIEFHWAGETATEGLDELEPALVASLPRADSGVEVHPYTPLDLYSAAVRKRRKEIENRFESELRSLVSRVSELLSHDASRGAERQSSRTLDRAMGQAGGMIDTDHLSHLVSGQPGATGLSAERRERLERAETTLRRHLDEWSKAPRVIVLDSGMWTQGEIWPDVRFAAEDLGLEDAVEVFEQSAEPITELFRAVRLLRLELAESYDPGRHDAALARFDWRSVTAEELVLFPQIVAIRRAEASGAGATAGLTDLLCSGFPVHVLLLDRPLRRLSQATGRTQLEIGYLAIAHRDAFVLQSTLARPEHLLSGLDRMVGSGRAAMAMIAVPSSSDDPPVHELQLQAAHEGLATPCFCYDPESGDSWAASFAFEDDAPEEQFWAVHELAYRDEQGVDGQRTEAFTFAHAAALEPAFRRHFRLVAPESWEDAQLEIADYLKLSADERRGKLPFIWVVIEGRLSRAVVTHDLAAACRDRIEARRLFRELASLGRAARPEPAVQVESPAAAPAALPADEVERIRQEAGQAAIQRLVNVLLDIGDSPALFEVAGTAAAAPMTPAKAPVAEGAPTAASSVTEQPYIDSALCTTCDDCTKLNSRMFRYNEDKQAYIADPTAGTFAQLVKAAEKCPARCIHPGTPRSGDKSATDALRARAKRFN